MGNHAPANGTIQKFPICFECVCPNNSTRLLIHGGVRVQDGVRSAPVQMVERAAVKEHGGKQYTSIPASEAAGHAVTSGLPVLSVEEP